MSNLQILIEMGFSPKKSQRALDATNHVGVETAMEWLLEQTDEEIERDDTSGASERYLSNQFQPSLVLRETNREQPTAEAVQGDEKVVSKDTRIQVRLPNGDLLTEVFQVVEPFSAVRLWVQLATNNDQPFSLMTNFPKRVFSENDLGTSLAVLGLVPSAALILSQNLEPVPIQIATDEVPFGHRNEAEKEERKKFLDRRKQELEEDRLLRLRIRAQFEDDKAAHRERLNRGQPSVQGSSSQMCLKRAASTSQASVEAATSQGAVPKPSTSTRIQVRLQDGSLLTETFNSQNILSAVRLWVQSKRPNQPISFMTNFPNRVFTEEDYLSSLEALSLVPSAMLIVPQLPEKMRVVCGEEDTYDEQRKRDEAEKKKFIEERKRELEEQRVARERVLAQIDDDKEVRKVRFEPRMRLAQASHQASMAQRDVTPKNPTDTEIQVRFNDGTSFTKTFDVREKFSVVRLWAQSERGSLQPITLMTNYPSRVFTAQDYEKSLDVLGLVPSAVLLTKTETAH